MSESREKLATYLFSDEYLHLLERAVLARLATTTKNHDKHAGAIELIRELKVDQYRTAMDNLINKE